MRRTVLVLGLLAASCGQAPGEEPRIDVEQAWARPTAAGQTGTAAYFTLTNSGGADRLTGVAADIGRATLHSTSIDRGVMRMRPVEGLDVPAGQTVEFKPGGVHVMIGDLRQPLPAGSSFPLRLTFAASGETSVSVRVGDGKPAR